MMVPARTSDERTTLIAYLASKIGTNPAQMVGSMPFEIVAITRDGKPRGAVLYTNKRSTTIEMMWAGEPGWLTHGNLKSIFSHAFEQLGCYSVLGMIKCNNCKSCELAERLGCHRVGLVPHAFGEDDHGYLYCMRRDDCQWIKQDRTGAPAAYMNGAAYG